MKINILILNMSVKAYKERIEEGEMKNDDGIYGMNQAIVSEVKWTWTRPKMTMSNKKTLLNIPLPNVIFWVTFYKLF